MAKAIELHCLIYAGNYANDTSLRRFHKNFDASITTTNKCDFEEEFEKIWAQMIIEGSLHNNGWLDDLIGTDILSTHCIKSTKNVCHEISKLASSTANYFQGLARLMII
ncbi:hypothetical protein IEQ34_007116 [Dendrobium chrysotoxum]|uniref:Uncharacterized protein n=1 Tax=Dendrobium chrysotoxum TaxID=161865 RepID=A0AAV7HA11_DENCH|nr:hypothetical protein IEQ34_007116 [Dendrobium chrysotoxum]